MDFSKLIFNSVAAVSALFTFALASTPALADDEEDTPPEVVSDGDITPDNWDATGLDRVVLLADANGNYSEGAASNLVHKADVAELVASNNATRAHMAVMELAANEALELTRLAAYNISTVPSLFATPYITGFKAASPINPETFRCAIMGWKYTTSVESKTVNGETVDARNWDLDFATTENLQTLVPDIACSETLDGFVTANAPTYLSPDLYTMTTSSGESFSNDQGTFANYYHIDTWLPTYYDTAFIRLDFDPDSGAAFADGTVTDIGGVPGGQTVNVTLGNGTVLHFEKGLLTVEGTTIVSGE